MNREEHLHRQLWDAHAMLCEHALLAEEYWDQGRGARWVIGQQGSFHARCEIIAGIGGSLIVHGDFDVARFAHYGDHGDAWSRLRWMGDCRDIGYYVRQKARIGMRAKDVDEYDERVARLEIEQRILEIQEEDEPEHDLVNVLADALRGHTESEGDLRSFLAEHDEGWDLWEWNLGRVLDFRVVVSHAALNKCAWLLRERYGALGPPACRRKVAA